MNEQQEQKMKWERFSKIYWCERSFIVLAEEITFPPLLLWNSNRDLQKVSRGNALQEEMSRSQINISY